MADEDFFPLSMIPSWGSLPIEQYLIKNWNYSATDAPGQQRRLLIHRFLDLDEIPEECIVLEFPSRMPTQEEVHTILQPWRSNDDLRRKAYYLSKDNVLVFLRTHYNPEDDSKMNEWVYETDLFEVNPWWACLNDPRIFNFGSDWQRVYEIMPEVTGPIDCRSRFAELSEPNRIQNTKTAAYIAIADQEAFQTGRLRLLCLDNKRNIVREVRVNRKFEDIMELIHHWGPITEQ